MERLAWDVLKYHCYNYFREFQKKDYDDDDDDDDDDDELFLQNG